MKSSRFPSASTALHNSCLNARTIIDNFSDEPVNCKLNEICQRNFSRNKGLHRNKGCLQLCSLARAEVTVARNLQSLKSIYFCKYRSPSQSISSFRRLMHNPLKSFYCDMPINFDTTRHRVSSKIGLNQKFQDRLSGKGDGVPASLLLG